MELKIAVCDDMQSHRESIKAITDRILSTELSDEYYSKPVIEYSEFSSVDGVLASITEGGQKYNLLLSDIQMSDNKANGIDLAKEINKLLPDCRIIFVTGYPDYAMDVYETNHVYLVLKSRMNEGLATALKKAVRDLFNSSDQRIAVSSANGTAVLKASEIIYLERAGRGTAIVTDRSTVESKQSLNEIQKILPESKFIKCHNSFVVNLDKIKIYRAASVLTENDTEIPISKKFKDSFNNSFFMNIVAKSPNEVK